MCQNIFSHSDGKKPVKMVNCANIKHKTSPYPPLFQKYLFSLPLQSENTRVE